MGSKIVKKYGYKFVVDGQEKEVDESRFNDYGGIESYKEDFPDASVRMTSVSGKQANIPLSKYDDAVKAGFALSKWEKNDTINEPSENDFAEYFIDDSLTEEQKNINNADTTDAPAMTIDQIEQAVGEADGDVDTTATTEAYPNIPVHAPNREAYKRNLEAWKAKNSMSADDMWASAEEEELRERLNRFDSDNSAATHTPLRVEDKDANLQSVRDIVDRNKAVNDIYSDVNKKMLEYGQRDMLGKDRAVQSGVEFNPETKQFQPKYVDATGGETFNKEEAKATSRATEEIVRTQNVNDAMAYHFENDDELMSEIDKRIADIEAQGKEYTERRKAAKGQENSSLFERFISSAKDVDNRNKGTHVSPEVALSEDLNDPEFRNLITQKILLQQAKKRMEASKRKDKGFWGEFTEGGADALVNPETLGGSTFTPIIGSELAKVSKKWERGEKLTEDEQNLVIVAGLLNEAQSKDTALGYDIGDMLGQVLPFIAEVAMNPAQGSSKAITKGVFKGLMRRYGATAIGNKLATNIGKRLTTGALRAAGDIGQASALAGTLQAPKVIGGAGKRMAGTAEYSMGADGELKAKGFTKKEGALEALGKSFATMAIENYTELLGEQFGALAKGFKYLGGKVGKGANKVLPKALTNVAKQTAKKGGEFMRDAAHLLRLDYINAFIKSQGLNKWINANEAFEKQIAFNGLAGEILEEEIAIPLNALLVGDEKIENLADYEHQMQILLGTALMTGGMAALRTPSFVYGKRKASKDYNKATLAAERAIGKEEWEALRDRIDLADNDVLGDEVATIANNSAYNKEQKAAIVNYAEALQKQRGYNLFGDVKQKRGQWDSLYDEGYEAEGDNMGVVVSQLAEARAKVGEVFAIAEDGKLNDPIAYMAKYGGKQGRKLADAIEHDEDLSNEEKAMLLDYAKAEYRYNAMMEGIEDRVDSQLEEDAKAFDDITNKDTGTVMKVLVKGKDGVQFYAKSGNIIYDNTTRAIDGSKTQMANGSPMVVLYDPQARKSIAVSVYDLEMVVENVNADRLKVSMFESRRDALMAAEMQLVDGYATEARASILDRRTQEQKADEANSGYGDNSGNSEAISDRRAEEQKVVEAEGQDPNSLTEEQKNIIAPGGQKAVEATGVAERGGKAVDVEDVIAVYNFSKSDAVVARKQPEAYADIITDLEVDRQNAIAWSEGRQGAEQPDNWEYWKEREGLNEPVISDRRTEEQITPETKEQKAVEAEGAVDVQGIVAEWNAKTGEKVQVANSVEEVANVKARAAIEQGVKIKGWYDTRTGEVVVYAPNVKSAEDLVLTIVHENVSHKGLRDTLGEDIYNRMCDKTWEMMDEATRAKYESYAGVNSIKDETERHRAAADEYIASIAEKVEKEQKLTESERSIWSEVLKAIKEFIVKLYGDVKLTEQDIASIIRVSYERMRARGDIEANSANSGAEAKATETVPVVEAPKAEKKVRKPRAKSRPVDAKKEISRRLEEEWNDAPSDVKSTIESIANTDEVIDVEDVVYATLAELRSPKTRHKLILQGDGVIKGVTEELGLPAKELQKALGVNAFATRANGGISLQKMAENIVADLDRNITGVSNIDVADVRDMLIEAIQSAGEPADISYHRARRRIDVAEKVYADWKRNELELEAEYEREADAERAAEEFWLTEHEKAYESMEINYLDNTFADELAERERIINEQNRISNERINERGLGSNRLLRSQQTDTSGRVEEGSERQGIQEEVGDVVSWIQDAETQRGQVGGTTQRKVEAEVAKASKAKTAKKKAGEDIAKVEEAMKAEKAKRELKTKEDIEMRLAEIREEYEADKEGRDIQTQAEAMVELYGGYANAPKDVKAKIDAQVAKLSARRQELAAEERELEKKLATLTKKQTPTTLDTRTEGQKEDGGYSENSANSGAVEPYIKTDAELTEGEQKGIEYEISRLADGFGLKPSQLRGVEVKHNTDNTAIMVATEWSEGASTARVVELIADNGTSTPDRIWQAYVDGKPASKLMVDEDVNAKDMEELFDERGLLREPTIEDFLKRRGIEFSMADRDKAIGEARFSVEPLIGNKAIFDGMRKLEEGETSHVERVFTENKNFEFTTKNRIESYDDVAYIFKELENEAVENTFVALVKDGKPTVVHLGMGTSTASMVDFISANVAVRRINPDKIYFVHNHPSGMLKASQQDMNILDAMKNAFGEDVVQDGIIINTFSGKYGTFGAYGDIDSSDIPRDQEEFPIKVHSFSKSVYDRGYKPTSAKSSADIAAFITSQRLGDRPKIGMIVANNQLQIIGNIFLPYSEFTEENADAIANDIAYYTSVMGGNAAFLFGNAKLSEIEDKGLRNKVEYRANKQIRLLDYIEVDGGRYKSANDDGVRFRFSDSEEEFRATQKEAVEKKGIVMPNLATTEFEIVHIPRHDFTGTGNQAIEKAEKWAKENLDSQYTYRKGTKDEFVYSIDKDSIGKFLSESSTKKSANLGVHLAVLKKLPDVINASIEAEIHADYKKNDNSRLDENGINDEDLLIHRMYGAVEIDGVIYRAKTTIKERLNKSNNVYDYKVTDIDLVISGSASSDALTKPMSVDGAKLLQGVEKSYDKGKYLLDGSVKNVKSSEEEDDYSGEGGVRFAVVEDEKLIKRLDADEKIIGYRNVVLNEDGTFESPMANSLRSTDRKAKEKTGGFELNKWERSEERPHLVDKNGKITLVKPDGKAVEKVDYNPYIHNRLNMVNKQFKQAWERPNLVYIKTEIPLSDLESGYHAEKAKLPVGEHKWNGGNLILSRYDKPVEICDWNDVADDWQASFKKEGINFDIIPPALLPILEERGMKILRPHKNMGDACNKAYADWAEARGIDTKGFWAEVAKETEEAEQAKAKKQAKAKSKKAEGGVRFRFIGEEGAKSMDKKEGTTARMDNLAVAKKMLDEYSYKEVKMATGWEKGMDGKWRYETPDFEKFDVNGNLKFVQRHPDYARYRELVKKNHMAMLLNQDPLTEAEQAELDKLKAKWGGAFGKMDNVTTLDAYVQDDDLFNAYPELKSIRVKLTDELPKGTRGRFVRREADDILILDPEEIQGTIYLNSRYPLREVESTLIHEIQHAIQHIEGFAKGGNSEMINEEEQRKYEDAVEFTKERIESHRQLIHEYLEQQGEISDKMNDWYNRHGDEAEFDAEMRALDEKWDAIDKKIDGIQKRIREDERWLEDNWKQDFRLGYEGYRALAGEVEARNVQKRRGMTPEERRNSLAEETEDVKRGQQIVIGAKDSGYSESLAEEQKGGVRFSVSEEDIAKANDDFYLTKDNADEFEYALMQSIAGAEYSSRGDYKRLGDMEVRVKTHTPNWDNFVDQDEDKPVANKILNVTVGDYDNTDYRRSKGSYDEFVKAYPEVKAVDVEIEDGTYLGDALKQIKDALKDKGIEIGFKPAYDWVEKYSEDKNTLEWGVRFNIDAEEDYTPVWNEGESFAEANDRIRRKKTVLDIQLKQMERKRALGKSYDADKLEQLRAELEEVKAQIRYLEVGAPKPELAEGESETDASYVAKMNAWHDAMAEWNSKKYGEDAMLDNLLREASGAKADEDVTDEEFKQGLKDEEEKANLSVKEMKGLVKEQIRERRRGIEVSNWQDEMTIYDIKKRTTEEQRKLIPHILEGTYNDPQHRKDKRYADYLAQTGKTDVSSAEWSERKELLNDPRNVENTAITKNQHGLKESDIVEYAVDSDAEILVTGDNLNALIRFPNGDIYTLRKYGVQYLLHIHPEAKQNAMTVEDAELLGMFLRGEAEQYVPQGLREYVEKKEYDEGNTLEVVNEIREWYAEAWSQLEAEGMVYKKEAIEDYVTHIWDLKKSSPTAVTTMQKFLAATAPKALKDINNYVATNTPYVKERAIGSIRDGEAFGLVPKYEDITDIMRDYGHRMNEARENRRLVNFVKGLRVNGMEAIKEEGGRSGGLYIPIKNEALRGYEVHRDVKPVLDVIFGEYHTTDNLFLQKLGHVYDAWGGLLKKINLSLSLFHHGALTETAIAMTNPFYAGKTIFKNILWDAAFKGDVIKWAKTMGDNSETPAYNDVELTKDAVSHFVQLGATSDYATKEVQAITAKFAEWAEGKVGAEELATVLDFWNKGLDKFLWDYLHDGLKIYGYKKLSTEIRAKAEKEGWDEEVLNRALDEAGQLINDTYGGQHWDLLGVSPNALKWARRAFLSPDWTLSTLRQALAPFGFGQMYDDEKFWKKWFKNDPVADVRKRYGRAFWVTAALFFGGIMNGLNAYYRMKDEDEEKKKAEEIRKTRPEYKSPYELAYPDGMKWWDYTMLGNTQGHETHLFGGRYKDGKEQYVRWGKQFRELPELFFGRDGLSFPQPMIDKITGKLNPMINLMSNLSSGYSLNGFQNDFMRDTRGWDREWARLQVLVAAHLPYSIPTDGEKEFKMIDLVMPSTKGFSNWKGIDRFKTAILAGDMDFCDKVYDACVKNGLHADELLDVAIKQIEVDAKRAMVEGVEDLSDAVAQHDKETNPVRKQLLANYIKKQMSAQDYEEITKEEMREKAYLAINGGVSDKNIKLYDKLCNSNDVIEDWRITKGKAGLKKYVDDLKALKEETDDAELIAKYVADNAKYLNQYKQLDKVQGVITSLKKRLGEGKDAEVMAQIREVRKKAFTAKGQEYGKKKKAKAKKEKPAKPIADYGKELSWSESEE